MENLNKLIILLLLPVISFSQCENTNTTLDEALQNENVNQWFQVALSLSLDDFSYLNECSSPNMIGEDYILLAPGNDIPTVEITPLMEMGTDVMLEEALSYYVWEDTQSSEMSEFIGINDVNVIEEICTCNGIIYIIDGLVWSPTMEVNEYSLNKKLVKTIDITGRETVNKGLHINIYSDGSSEKIYLNE